MRIGVRDYSTHSDLRGALEQTVGDKAICLSDTLQWTENSQDTVVNARDDLANTSANTSLVAKVSDISSGLANNDACFLRGDDSSQGKLSLAIFFVCARRGVIISVQATELLSSVVEGRGGGEVFGRHVGYWKVCRIKWGDKRSG